MLQLHALHHRWLVREVRTVRLPHSPQICIFSCTRFRGDWSDTVSERPKQQE